MGAPLGLRRPTLTSALPPGDDRDLSEACSESTSLRVGQTEDRAAFLAVSAVETGPDDGIARIARALSSWSGMPTPQHSRQNRVSVRLNRGDNMQGRMGFLTITIIGRSDDTDVELHFRVEVVPPWVVTVHTPPNTPATPNRSLHRSAHSELTNSP